jgi:hypothetical protein
MHALLLTCALLSHVNTIQFYHIWFAQSSHLLTYIIGSGASNFHIEIYVLGSSQVLRFAFVFSSIVPLKLANCKGKKETWEAPYLVNKTNKIYILSHIHYSLKLKC